MDSSRIFPALVRLKKPVPGEFISEDSQGVVALGVVKLYLEDDGKCVCGASIGTVRRTCVVSSLDSFFRILDNCGCRPRGALVFTVFGAQVGDLGTTTSFLIAPPFRKIGDGVHFRDKPRCNPIVYKIGDLVRRVMASNSDANEILGAVTVSREVCSIVSKFLVPGLDIEFASFLAPKKTCVVQEDGKNLKKPSSTLPRAITCTVVDPV